MMRTCNKCGAGDDMENMNYIVDENGDTLCVCEGCAKAAGEYTPVRSLIAALRPKRELFIVTRMYRDETSNTPMVRVMETMEKALIAVRTNIEETFANHPHIVEGLLIDMDEIVKGADGGDIAGIVYDSDETRIEWGIKRATTAFGASAWVEIGG